MKHLFWPLVALLAALGVWFFSRQRIEALNQEIASLRPYKEKYDDLEANSREKLHRYREEEKARLAAMSPQERLDYEMNQATINSYIRNQLGGDLYDELTL